MCARVAKARPDGAPQTRNHPREGKYAPDGTLWISYSLKGNEATIGLASAGHDGSFLILDRVGSLDFVIAPRSHTGEVLSVYLMARDIEKVVEFISRKGD